MARLAAERDRRRALAPTARGDRAERGREGERERGGERPVEQLCHGPEAALVGRGGLELVEDPIDFRELVGVARAEVAPAGLVRERGQRRLVEIRGRIDLPQTEQR